MPIPTLAKPGAIVRSVKRLGRKVRKTGPIEARYYARYLPLKPAHVLYEAFYGQGVLCHPEAIFRELLDAPDMRHLHHIWVLKDPKSYAAFRAEFAGRADVTFVRRESVAYYRHLATAKYLVNNSTFPPHFSKREGQVYLNTWHGTPLKRMGFDEPGGVGAARNTVRNFLHADYVLSSGDYMTTQMYEQAYGLQNIAPRLRVIEEGEPRTDRQDATERDLEAIRARLREGGVDLPDGARMVLLAPTWKGSSFLSPTDDALELADTVRQLRRQLPSDCQVVLKVHQRVYDVARAHRDLRGTLVPNEVPTNDVLALTDVLVTDYSSIFFDYLSTGRPIIFHVPDEEVYLGERGVYLSPDELPGPRTKTVPALVELVSAAGSGGAQDPLESHREAYATARQRFAAKNDGLASRRVVDIVFRDRTAGYSVRPLRRDDRPRLLIYAGGMRSNGITSSLLNLTHHLDPQLVDTTVVFDYSRQADRAANIALLPRTVRGLARAGGFQPGKVHWVLRRRFLAQGASLDPKDVRTMLGLLQDEWWRIFGAADFDHVIDFSGYSPFWAFLMACRPARTRAIWQHNDLKADQMRLVDGRRPHERNLGSVFSSYNLYDRLVSVSASLRDINAEQLADFAPPEKFVAARNLIDASRIRRAVRPADGAPPWPGDHLLAACDPDGSREDRAVILADHAELREEIERRWAVSRSPRQEGVFQFVTVGRMSPEKNHERLIRAFAAVHAQQPATRLVLIGDGPLRPSLTQLASDLGLGHAVVFTGLLRNPFALMAECDAFVLSSDYEGQPMVILEARTIGLPIVSTAFGSVGSALDDRTGLVVERDVDALAEGMCAALEGTVPVTEFDADEYNTEVTREFYRAVGIDVSV